MAFKSKLGFQSVGLNIRITDGKGHRHYERIHRRDPQMCRPRDVYTIRFEEDGKRKRVSVCTDLVAANSTRFKKENELGVRSKETAADPKPSPAKPKSLEQLREAFLHDRMTTIKQDGSPLDPDSIRRYDLMTREFLDVIQRELPGNIVKQRYEEVDDEAADRRRKARGDRAQHSPHRTQKACCQSKVSFHLPQRELQA